MYDHIIKKVLMPVDYSDVTIEELDLVSTFCHQHLATLTLIHVINKDQLPAVSTRIANSKIVNKLISGRIKSLNDVATKIRLSYDIVVDSIVQIGNLGEEICEIAIRKNYNLIVLGSPFQLAEELHISPDTFKILQYAPCPVLVFPPG